MLSIPIDSTMKRLSGEAHWGRQLLTLSQCPDPGEFESRRDTVNKTPRKPEVERICSVVRGQHPGPYGSGDVSTLPCQKPKQGYIRILPGVQTASSQMITESSIKVSWAIHSMLIGENTSPILCLILTSVTSRKGPLYLQACNKAS
jgi:hypothetical protein